jgi:hypothetical protein
MKEKMDVKPKFLKIMKQKIFTLIMMLALVIVAGSAFAQNTNDRVAPKDSVKTNSTVGYSLGGIVVNTEGTLTVGYSGADATIQDVNLTESATPDVYIVPTGTQTLTFNIVFGEAATSGTITVEVTDGATSGCANHITLGITVFPEPTIDIALTMPSGADSLFCQSTDGVLNNVAASSNSKDSIDFTVTPTIENDPTSFTVEYTLGVVGTGLTGLSVIKVSAAGTFDGTNFSGTAEQSTTFRVRWTTTTGQAQIPLIATAGTATLTDTSDGGDNTEYTETVTTDNTDRIQVKSTPSIGTFN